MMYNNESFDDYIRSILGYPNSNYMYQNDGQRMNDRIPYDTNNAEELEECYPEIYKIVYPMISQRCSNVTEPVTREMVENMTDEIYSAIEVNNEINVNINLQNEVTNHRSEVKNTTKEPVKQNRGEDRQFRNRNLRDLIQILLIQELLRRRRPHRPGRPPFPGGRPPFPGGGTGRPPIMPRGYYNMDIYESY